MVSTIYLLVFTSSVVIVPHEDSGYKPGHIPVDRSLFEVLEVVRFSSQFLEIKKSQRGCWLDIWRSGDVDLLKLKTPKNGHRKTMDNI